MPFANRRDADFFIGKNLEDEKDISGIWDAHG